MAASSLMLLQLDPDKDPVLPTVFLPSVLVESVGQIVPDHPSPNHLSDPQLAGGWDQLVVVLEEWLDVDVVVVEVSWLACFACVQPHL